MTSETVAPTNDDAVDGGRAAMLRDVRSARDAEWVGVLTGVGTWGLVVAPVVRDQPLLLLATLTGLFAVGAFLGRRVGRWLWPGP